MTENSMIQAMLYEEKKERKVHCFLCNHQCIIDDGNYGFCGVRKNSNGTLYTETYGKLIAANLDPIEKKPLYHFLPGSKSYSIAAPGCNFRCGFCQNWQISQINNLNSSLHNVSLPNSTPVQVVEAALKSGAQSISCTYTEPTIFYEYAFDIFKIAKENGLKTIFVTNGYMTDQAIDLIKDKLDACNVDLKSFSEKFYQKNCKATLQPVLNSIKKLKKEGIWVEISTLLIPGQNDSETELASMADFLADLDPDIPWHISRFFPQYKFSDYHPTPESTIFNAVKIAEKAGIHFIYPGNISGEINTKCFNCGQVLLRRVGYKILSKKIISNTCSNCNSSIKGIWSI